MRCTFLPSPPEVQVATSNKRRTRPQVAAGRRDQLGTGSVAWRAGNPPVNPPRQAPWTEVVTLLIHSCVLSRVVWMGIWRTSSPVPLCKVVGMCILRANVAFYNGVFCTNTRLLHGGGERRTALSISSYYMPTTTWLRSVVKPRLAAWGIAHLHGVRCWSAVTGLGSVGQVALEFGEISMTPPCGVDRGLYPAIPGCDFRGERI